MKALNTRAKGAEIDIEALFDGSEEALGSDDTEPTAPEDGDLAALIDLARRLVERPNEDPKLAALLRRLKPMLKEGFSPIVFCRYISTAQWVGRALQKALGGMRVEVVHGEMPSDERRARIEAMDDGEQKILVATDCLSEGIDLQDIFDAVVHYDLCWNPTRHQQREGRVDRFGQQKSVVRSLTIYGKNNPVDGVVIEVIVRKANVIRKETGVPVAFPEEDREMSAALFRAMLHRRKDKSFGRGVQGEFDFGATPEAKKIEAAWRNASEREKANRTIFAQRSLKPEEVMVEWEKTVDVLGDGRDTARFFERSLAPARRSLRQGCQGLQARCGQAARGDPKPHRGRGARRDRYACASRAAAATICTATIRSSAPSQNSWSRTRSIPCRTPTDRRSSPAPAPGRPRRSRSRRWSC